MIEEEIMSTVTQPITAEEFLAMDLGEGIHELVRGEIVEMPPPMPEHGRICFNAGFQLEAFARPTKFGYVLSNDSAVPTERGPDTVRGADICFYSEARWPRERVGWELIPVLPDLVVEVYSPSNRPGEMRDKVYEYLRAGVMMVWVIHPSKRQLWVYRMDELGPSVYSENDVVENLPELPGFHCVVSDFFA